MQYARHWVFASLHAKPLLMDRFIFECWFRTKLVWFPLGLSDAVPLASPYLCQWFSGLITDTDRFVSYIIINGEHMLHIIMTTMVSLVTPVWIGFWKLKTPWWRHSDPLLRSTISPNCFVTSLPRIACWATTPLSRRDAYLNFMLMYRRRHIVCQIACTLHLWLQSQINVQSYQLYWFRKPPSHWTRAPKVARN